MKILKLILDSYHLSEVYRVIYHDFAKYLC